MHMFSLWKHQNLQRLKLEELSYLTYHKDARWKWRDLPEIQREGLITPITVWRMTVKQYYTQLKYYQKQNIPPEPVIVEDDKIYGVKAGNNRIRVAKFLGFVTIDAMVFDDHTQAVRFANWIKKVDRSNYDKISWHN